MKSLILSSFRLKYSSSGLWDYKTYKKWLSDWNYSTICRTNKKCKIHHRIL